MNADNVNKVKTMFLENKKMAICGGGFILFALLAIILFSISSGASKQALEKVNEFVAETDEIKKLEYEDFSYSLLAGKTHIKKPKLTMNTGEVLEFDSCDFKINDKDIYISFNGYEIPKKDIRKFVFDLKDGSMSDYPDMIKVNGFVDASLDADKKTFDLNSFKVVFTDLMTFDVKSGATGIVFNEDRTELVDDQNIVINNVVVAVEDKGFLEMLKKGVMESNDIASEKYDKEIKSFIDYVFMKYIPWASDDIEQAVNEFIEDPYSVFELNIDNEKKLTLLEFQERIMRSFFTNDIRNPFEGVKITAVKS